MNPAQMKQVCSFRVVRQCQLIPHCLRNRVFYPHAEFDLKSWLRKIACSEYEEKFIADGFDSTTALGEVKGCLYLDHHRAFAHNCRACALSACGERPTRHGHCQEGAQEGHHCRCQEAEGARFKW